MATVSVSFIGTKKSGGEANGSHWRKGGNKTCHMSSLIDCMWRGIEMLCEIGETLDLGADFIFTHFT